MTNRLSTATRRNPLRFCDGCGTCGQRDIKTVGDKMFCKKCREQTCARCEVVGQGDHCPACTRAYGKDLLEAYGAIDPTPRTQDGEEAMRCSMCGDWATSDPCSFCHHTLFELEEDLYDDA